MMNVTIKGKKINIFMFGLIGLLSIILLLATILGGYMLVRRVGQLKNNSLSTKLEAYNIENDFWDFDKFDKEYENILFGGIDNFNNTDVLMIISINKRLHNINILRIPRDTYIGDRYKTGKINAVYSSPTDKLSGADMLTYEINNIFRIKVDKYIFMTLDIFEELVDDIGGVDVTLKHDLKIDENNIIKSGKVHLDGKLGTDFVRHRKSYLLGDIGRIHAQEQFIKAFGKKLVEEKYMSNIPFLNKYYNLVETNIGRKEINRYSDALKDVDVDEISTFVFEGEAVTHNKYSVYVLDVDKVVNILNDNFMPEGKKLTKEDIKLVSRLEADKVSVNDSSEENTQEESCVYESDEDLDDLLTQGENKKYEKNEEYEDDEEELDILQREEGDLYEN